jgi:hypothetical protein
MPAKKPALRRFFRYEIAPTVTFENGLNIPYPSVADARRASEAPHWSLYGMPPRVKVVIHIGNFSDYEKAAEVYSYITGRAAPANPDGRWMRNLPAGP